MLAPGVSLSSSRPPCTVEVDHKVKALSWLTLNLKHVVLLATGEALCPVTICNTGHFQQWYVQVQTSGQTNCSAAVMAPGEVLDCFVWGSHPYDGKIFLVLEASPTNPASGSSHAEVTVLLPTSEPSATALAVYVDVNTSLVHRPGDVVAVKYTLVRTAMGARMGVDGRVGAFMSGPNS